MKMNITALLLLMAACSTLHADKPSKTTTDSSQQAHGGGAKSYTRMIESHFQKMAETGSDAYGPDTNMMWMSVVGTRTGHPPKVPHTPKRVYRLIGAPNGTTFYWDQPLVVAAHILSHQTGKPQYAESANLYAKAFLERCVEKNGMFQWGNHMYYDVVKDEVVKFTGGYHELRPLVPAWDLLWEHEPKVTERYIRTMLPRHIYDPETGGFNRHDTKEKVCSFIESGGILVESSAWLYSKTKDPKLLETALKIANYSYSHRGKKTGLIINQPDKGRWDSKVSTTEVGLWAQSLLRAHKYTGNDEFLDMAQSAVLAYLKYGYDEKAKKYYGQLNVKNGKPVSPQEKGYWPQKYSNIWNLDQWPNHDYPISVAEACITLYEETGNDVFRNAVYRWAEMIGDATSINGDKGAYAEQYGRCIHFLDRAGRVFKDESLGARARKLADTAIEALYDNDMFQGFPKTHLYESVDGVGYLFLALLSLEDDKEFNLYGFGF